LTLAEWHHESGERATRIGQDLLADKCANGDKVRSSMRSPLEALRATYRDIKALGFSASFRLIYAWFATILKKDYGLKLGPRLLRIKPRSLLHPLLFRTASSDLYVIRQILVEEEYAPLVSLKSVKFIIDCGANIGCSAAFFLSRFPEAKLIAVEPDQANFDLLSQNLGPYGSRARAIRAAIWSDEVQLLATRQGQFVDGLEWAVTVEPVKAADPQGGVPSITLSGLLKRDGQEFIDLLKIDIEGAEEVVFSGDCRFWLSRTRNLCIELHGDQCRSIFDSAMSSYTCDRQPSGELIVCRNIAVV
jgi:FkbM family methyltransferase